MNKYLTIAAEFNLGSVQPYIFRSGQPMETRGGDYPAQQVNLVQSDLASWMGTPIISEVVLENQAGDVAIMLDTVIIEVSQTKIVVRTNIAGRNGTVKEYVSMDDYSITIRGGIFNQDPQSYPSGEVDRLIQLLTLGEPLKMSNDFLQAFGIYDVVVTGYNMPQRSGNVNSQLFEIKGYSDEPIELTIDEEA